MHLRHTAAASESRENNLTLADNSPFEVFARATDMDDALFVERDRRVLMSTKRSLQAE